MGACGAVLGFGDVIARKSLGMSGLAVTILTMSGPITALATIWWGAILTGRDQRKLLLWLGVVSTVILMSVALLSAAFQLILIYYLFCFAVTVFGPAENRVMQQHLPPHSTGKVFGLASGGRTAMGALMFVAAGFWMDHHTEGFRQIYPAGALISMIGILLMATIPTGKGEREKGRKGESWSDTPLPIDRTLIAKPVKDVIALLRRRKDFLRFEIAFMTYGVAFMLLMPVVPLYLVDDLKLSYSTIGLARGALMQVAMIPAMPIFGRIFDRSTPHRMGAWIFALLVFYPLLLLAAGKTDGTLRTALVYAAFGWFGVVMSGLSVIWSLSSIRFAAGEDVGIYQSVHVAATGVRGLVAPLLGYAVMTIFSKEAAMITSAVLWVAAGGMMVWMRRIDRRSGEATSLRAEVRR
jgi:predicted MFS family arabinose efflux permease